MSKEQKQTNEMTKSYAISRISALLEENSELKKENASLKSEVENLNKRLKFTEAENRIRINSLAQDRDKIFKRYEIQIEELQKQLFNKQQDLDVLRDLKIEADIKLKKTRKALQLAVQDKLKVEDLASLELLGLKDVSFLRKKEQYYLEQANKFFDRR